jgi:hypothetical protein
MPGVLASAFLGRAVGSDSRALVATPDRRAEYLARLLRALCTEIGPRPAGSREFDAGALVIEQELRRALPAVSRDPFRFRKWELAGDPEFWVDRLRLETYLAEDSPGTSALGLHGKLKKSREAGYEIVEPVSGRILARAGISEFGRAIPTVHSGSDELPLFNIGKQDAGMLDRAVREGQPVRLKAEVRWVDGASTCNVAGTLPGMAKEEILVVAHADTKYNTPGANDNTASLICMLMMAQAMPTTRPWRTISFLATTGEERGFIGAKHYALTRKQQGTLGDIKVCINLDSLTYGPNLQIATTDPELEKIILDIHRDLGIRSQPKVLRQDDTMDSGPFHAAGARTVHLNSRGDDARTLPLWHRPEDRAATINPEFVESSFRILMELCARLASAQWRPRPAA